MEIDILLDGEPGKGRSLPMSGSIRCRHSAAVVPLRGRVISGSLATIASFAAIPDRLRLLVNSALAVEPQTTDAFKDLMLQSNRFRQTVSPELAD